jgi:hypothetical protein
MNGTSSSAALDGTKEWESDLIDLDSEFHRITHSLDLFIALGQLQSPSA